MNVQGIDKRTTLKHEILVYLTNTKFEKMFNQPQAPHAPHAPSSQLPAQTAIIAAVISKSSLMSWCEFKCLLDGNAFP